jgi:hypothetical protein
VLIFQRWRQQTSALFSPLCFKVLRSITNISTHGWSVDLAQGVLGSSCLIFEMAPCSLDPSDMSSFLTVARALHPEPIPLEVGCAILEPVEPFMECATPLFLRSSEIIHSKWVTSQFWVFIQIWEIHDFNRPSDSENDSSLGGDWSGEDYLDCDLGCSFL